MMEFWQLRKVSGGLLPLSVKSVNKCNTFTSVEISRDSLHYFGLIFTACVKIAHIEPSDGAITFGFRLLESKDREYVS